MTTWRGVARTLAAAQRRSEREAARQQRELEKQQKLYDKMHELERAAYEVELYENHIEVLSSVHKDCGEELQWEKIKEDNPPTKPTRSSNHENKAQSTLDNYSPGLTDKLFRRVESKKAELEKAIEDARTRDGQEYQDAVKEYEQMYADWEASRELASSILDGNIDAYVEAIKETDPFSEIKHLGSSIEFKALDIHIIEATLHVNNDIVIPREVKSLLRSGKLSIKDMTKSKFYELYQDYVCGCALRIARELFALLPIEMAIINTVGMILNAKTGHMEEQPILSVAIPGQTLSTLNFDSLDPSDSMENFVHNMKFRKTKGFDAVKRIQTSDLGI